MHKLWYDCETGGTDYVKNPVLEAYFAFCDENNVQFDELHLLLKPDDMSKYEVTQEALDVNGINLEEHLANPKTLTYSQAKPILIAKLNEHKIPKKRISFQPCGHNIGFDEDFMMYQIMGSKEEWRKLVHYRVLDTSPICSFLKDVGIFPAHLGKLGSLVEYFGIPMLNAHRAKDDVLMNVEVYRRMKKLMGEKKTGMSGIDKNLLSIVEM